MRNASKFIICALIAGVALVGCHEKVTVMTSSGTDGDQATNNAEGVLKKTMDAYMNLKSFQADCKWSAEGMAASTRKLAYEQPNKFNVDSSINSMTMTAISDGKDLIEYSSASGAQKYAAPDSINKVASMQMKHPMFCGSILYSFFGGSGSYSELVDASKGAPTFGAEVTSPNGEKCQTVKFYAAGPYYGNTTVEIGENTGTVYKISYDSAPLMEMMKGMAKDVKAPPSYITIETYENVKLNSDVSKDLFVAKAPKGTEVKEAFNPSASREEMDKPPVPFGSQAPDFVATSLSDSKPVKISGLKGKVVLIDFWATWCGPCKEGLPHTEALYKDFKDKGLEVMAVSDEEPGTIKDFFTKSGYSMPVFQDAGRNGNTAYKIVAIPTTVIIDRDGKLAGFFVGLHDDSEIRAKLKSLKIE